MTSEEFDLRISESLPNARAWILSKYSLNKEDLEDIIQNASLKAVKSFGSFKGKSAFNTWFMSVCRNEVFSFFRCNKKFQSSISIEDVCHGDSTLHCEPEVIKMLERNDRLHDIKKAMSQLSQKHRQIIEIAIKTTNSSSETAKLLNIPVSSARTRLHYAKKRLKKLLKSYAHQSNAKCLNN